MPLEVLETGTARDVGRVDGKHVEDELDLTDAALVWTAYARLRG